MIKEAIEAIKHKFQVLKPLLDERSRRWWAACEAEVLGWGGIAVVSQATGISRTTIAAGLREYRPPTERSQAVAVPRTRQAGGGRKPLTQQDPHLLRDWESLVDPVTRGDPPSPPAGDVQKYLQTGERTRRDGTSGGGAHGGTALAEDALQVASESEDARRGRSSRSGCPVPSYQ